jgi:predicted membrane GTPase involved in stress response
LLVSSHRFFDASATVEPISSPPLDAPTIAVTISPNTSPINGRDGGKNLTAAVIRTRLMRETENNVAVQVYQSPHEVNNNLILLICSIHAGPNIW